MDQFFAYADQFDNGSILLSGEELHHLKDVLRKKPGDKVRVCSREGGAYLCVLTEVTQEYARAKILDLEDTYTELSSPIVLFQGLAKGEKMDFVVQKAVELGAVEIVPVAMKNCVVKLDEKKAAKKVERWQSIAENAARQAKRSVLPKVSKVSSFRQALDYGSSLDVLLMPYEHERGMLQTKQVLEGIKKGQSIGVLIGPEGGFDPGEVEDARKCAQVISLGKRILRTETAGLTALSILMYYIELLEEGEKGEESGSISG